MLNDHCRMVGIIQVKKKERLLWPVFIGESFSVFLPLLSSVGET